LTATISKSRYLAGLQCPKLLWHHLRAPDLVPPPDPALQAIFDTGHAVGDLAKQLFPDGVEVPWSGDLAQTVAVTRELLAARRPIFEASFEHDRCYCRADILAPTGAGAWDLYEVKSGTTVKDVNIEDVAFQAQVIEQSGLVLDRLAVMHVDSRYVRRGAIDPAGLLQAEDVTVRARAAQPGVAGRVAAMQAMLAGECPDMPLGTHCHEPYACVLRPLCSAFLPAHDVTQLYRASKARVYDLIARGITALADVPDSDLSAAHRVQREAIVAGRRVVEAVPLRAWLAGLEYPLHCLDFETMNPAVPLVDGTRPYQQVPFQFSLHVVDGEGAEPRHVEHLACTPGDPRPGLIEALRTVGTLARAGTVLAYNAPFERGVLRGLAEAFPEHGAFLTAVVARFEDLKTPFSRFWVHDAGQRGSCSLKQVLPTLTSLSYGGLAIADGNQASREFMRVVFGDAPAHERAAVLDGLREYCRQDTWAMVEVLGVLRGFVVEAVEGDDHGVR
jgi:hypothetical protein